jgi:hypothetical protein
MSACTVCGALPCYEHERETLQPSPYSDMRVSPRCMTLGCGNFTRLPFCEVCMARIRSGAAVRFGTEVVSWRPRIAVARRARQWAAFALGVAGGTAVGMLLEALRQAAAR